MKNILTLKNAVKACAAVFGLVAFFLMFANQLYAEVLGNKGYVAFNDALFGDYGAVLSFVGYLLAGVSALAVCALVFLGLDAKVKKLCNLVLALLFIVAAVFLFLEATIYNGNVGSGSVFHLAAAPIIAAIFSIVAGVATCVSEFLPSK